MPKYEKLFEPGYIGNAWVKNRVVMAPVVTNYASASGEVTEQMLDYYEARARGGVGTIIVEGSCVDSPVGRESLAQICIDHPRYLPGLNRLAETIKMHGVLAFIQLLHTGRQTSRVVTSGKAPVAPSAIPCPMMKEMPRELSISEIKEIEAKFINAAHYAYQAGFDGIELHAAHGYLINQFLSRHTNIRTDEYGGSLENRQRFLTEIVAGIKNEVPNLLISVRLNLDDFVDEGLTMEESLLVCESLEKLGINLINVSCGTYESGLKSIEPLSYEEGWRVYLAEAVKKRVKIPVIAGGIIRHPAFANQVLAEKKADFIFLGRALLADPEWPIKAFRGEERKIRPCINCNICISRNFQGLQVNCAVNPWTGREKKLVHRKIKSRQAIVVGGGIAGIQAALSLDRAGYKVTLFEKSSELGGMINLAGVPPYKEAVFKFKEYLLNQLEDSLVNVLLNKELTVEIVKESPPDVLVIATGSRPRLNGQQSDGRGICVSGNDVLAGKCQIAGQNVFIIGGGSTGCEIADYLSQYDNHITIVEANPYLAMDMEKKNRRDLMNRLEEKGVVKMTSAKVEKITETGLQVTNGNGETLFFPADKIVMATGFDPLRDLYTQCKFYVPHIYLIGDAYKVRGFREALLEAAMVVN